jgi:hypothetical protein
MLKISLKSILLGIRMRRRGKRFGREYISCITLLSVAQTCAELCRWDECRQVYDLYCSAAKLAANSYIEFLKMCAEYDCKVTFDPVTPLIDEGKKLDDIWG